MREIKFEFIYSDGTVFLKAKATFEELCDNNAPNDYMYEKALDEMYEDYQGVENFDIVCKRQSTGLKDKNGVLIFEGDVVKWGHLEGWSKEYYHRVAEVELFPSLQFRILHYFDARKNEKKDTDGHIFEFGGFAYKETYMYLEVIGNIYENPELLKNN